MSKWLCLPKYGEFEIICGRDGKPLILGEGSFGKTFEAFREDSVAGGMIREYAALKVLNPALLGSENKRFQFIQELTALTKLKHANLIHYIRCGEEQGQVYYAMELCRGGDLTRLVKRFGTLPERTAALIGLQIATGLKEVHRQRLIHRDIKPSNIMLVDEIPEGTSIADLDLRLEEQESLCRIVDFGLVDFALEQNDSQAELPRQRFVGSPMFASPEQICERPVSARSDLYSLGMTLWFLVLGRGPLTDASGRALQSERDVLRMHVDPLEYAQRLPSHLSPEFRQILATLLAKKPEQRYANANDVQHALRSFLDQPAASPATVGFRVHTTQQQIDEVFRFHGNILSPRFGLRRYQVENIKTGDPGCLYVVQDKESYPDPIAHRENLTQLSSFGELSCLPDFPSTILKINQVVDSIDALCCIEELASQTTLADVLRVRGRSRPFSFREAATLLDPLSSALDFLIRNGKQKVLIPCEEIYLDGSEVQASPISQVVLATPLSEWQNFRVAFSMLWLESSEMDEHFDPTSTMSWSTQTMSGAMQSSDSSSHPVQSFCRLVYRMMSGSEVAAAAEYSPHAFLPVVELSAASNNLLRDVLCGQLSFSEVSEVFGQLCMHEALPRPNRSTNRSRSATRPSSSVTGSAPGFASAPSITSPYQSASATRSHGSVSYGTSSGSVDYRRDLPVAEIVSPGVIISPFDQERRPIRLNADQWKELAPVICPYAQRPFRLPSRLDPLEAMVIEPGLVASPFDPNGTAIRIDWQEWQPGKKIVCRFSGKPFVLPYDIPWPEGIVPPNVTQQAISPYDSSALLTDIPLRDWIPGGEVHCPVTGFPFLLPLELPAPQAIIAPNRPGEIASPYSPAIRWMIEPEQWIPGARHICRATQRSFVLPEDILRWPAPPAILINADERLVGSPFAPSKTFTVDAANWRPGFRVDCPFTKRKVSLPNDLPAIVGEVVSGKIGTLRSPFTGEEFAVNFNDWHEGAEITCPGTRSRIRLPSSLPAWIPFAEIMPDQPGKVINPHTKEQVEIAPQDWNDGQKLTCPTTGKEYQLPQNLKPLEAIVLPEQPGKIRSPYADDATTQLDLDDWFSGNTIKCSSSGKPLVLPAELPEWLAEASYVERQPGKVRSPYGSKELVELKPDQWCAGSKVQCPASKRFFQLPQEPALPTLEQELLIVDLAYAEPENDASQAAEQLSKSTSHTTAEMVESVWKRHQLDSTEKRRTALELAEPIPAQPGYVRSPYGSKPTVKIPASIWAQPETTFACTETKRLFILPNNLPPLHAIVPAAQPGKIISPYAQDQGSFEVTPEQWAPNRQITCPHSQKLLTLPPDLPRWVPVAELVNKQPGLVQSPFLKDQTLHILGKDWRPGKVLRCSSGREYKLPDHLPPLVGLHPQDGIIESPYELGAKFPIPADEWKPGHRVICPSTRLPLLLPDPLPEIRWLGKVLQPGRVRSPFGKRPTVNVSAANWEKDKEITCPETKRTFVLPDPLPPMAATVIQDKPGVVKTPYVANKEVNIPIEDWQPDNSVLCPATNRPLLLPQHLPAWIGVAKIHPHKSGWVFSPYHTDTEIPVAPENWTPEHPITCPVTKRQFSLPKDLPPLQAIIVDGEHGKVQSPHDPDGAAQVIPPEQWLPGERITCTKTKQPFTLPTELPELALDAILIPGQAGKIRSPYASKQEINVPGKDWKSGQRILCPETKFHCQLPEELPPMTASIVPGEPGKLLTPYEDQKQVTINLNDWIPDKIIQCPATNRPLKLPSNLPAISNRSQSTLLIVIGGILIFILALATTYFLITAEKSPDPATEISAPETLEKS